MRAPSYGDGLERLVAEELSQPVDPRVSAMAAALAARYPAAARAVLFYGSCLREQQLDGLMLDFYLIVSDYRAAYGDSWLVRANALIPPNVFPFEQEGLMAKYAVLDMADFARLNRVEASNVSVWARFAQPTRLIWASDDGARSDIIAAIAEAPVTLFTLAAPLCGPSVSDPLAYWKTGFAQTYRAELRAERTDRSGLIVDADPARYAAFTPAVTARMGHRFDVREANRKWARLRRNGKLLSLARLAKATFTFAGGIDYLAWKINRHAGTAIEVTPWQRRHPILAALLLLPRLLRSGAIR